MKKVIVFGDLPIATKIVMFLEKMQNVEIGVVIGNQNPHNNDPWNVECLVDYCRKKEIAQYTLKEIVDGGEDGYLTLGLSCRFSKIISSSVIRKFKNGIINMHGGLLPEFAGLCSVNHTLLQKSPVGGGTLHYIDAGIDTGAIIKRCEFPVEVNDTAFSLFQKTQIVLEESLEEIIPAAMEGCVPTIDQNDLISVGHKAAYYNKKDLEKYREIDLQSISSEDLAYRIRAFDFPGYEPAYFKDITGRKVYLRYSY